MRIKKIGDWTCQGCKTLLTITKDSLKCDVCGRTFELNDLFKMDDKNVYFNEVGE